jgi:hypothetical protein
LFKNGIEQVFDIRFFIIGWNAEAYWHHKFKASSIKLSYKYQGWIFNFYFFLMLAFLFYSSNFF